MKTGSRTRTSRRFRRSAVTLGATAALVVGVAGSAYAAPPAALPANAEALEKTWQPAYDYDTDGCYATPAIGATGTVNGGLKPTGSLSGDCRDASDLDNTNGYSRYKCNNGWCAIMYDLYFEKDQAVAGSGIGGHRHDWEHVVVWVQNGTARYVSTSNHGGFTVHAALSVRWDGTHAKIVYHKDGIRTHCFRLAGSNDEPPENHKGTWQYPPLVGWNGYPSTAIRDTLVAYDFGSANFGLKDGSFASNLTKAMPSGITFDPNA
ncbi:NPP1 family protein [Streptomyces stelliscabiei]|uniref:NPP1 family protein n=1 Tax=Streptomyces stelliscabiei TaxID=146820 RepID=UPI002FF0A56A